MEVKNSPASAEAIKSTKDPCFKHKNGSLFPKKRRLVKTMMFHSMASAIFGSSCSSKTQDTAGVVTVVSRESRPPEISDV
ncbi:hypothetical protein IMY05_005G0139700 [Salix suchowensis]|nr:hypothetical protein IMY05_005G0139700 [Salix suchowensis]